MPAVSKIQLRHGTAAAWTSANPVLALGEPGYETDTGKEKRGDGSTAWNSLPYFTPGTGAFAPVRTFDVKSYGAKGDGSTDDTAAFTAAVTAAQAAGGGTLYFPPSPTAYVGSMTLTGNYRFQVAGYGAILLAPDNGVGLDIATAQGGSALGSTVQGLHFKGSASQNATGLRITNTDRTRIRDCSFERLAAGVAIRTTAAGGANGSEANVVEHSEFNNCTIGIDLQPSDGSGHFDESIFWDLNVNNCPTGISAASAAVLFPRAQIMGTFWIPTNGVAFLANTNLDRVAMRLMGENYQGVATGCVGLRIGSSTTNWTKADITLMFNGSITSSNVIDLQTVTGAPIVYRDGMVQKYAVAGGATSWGYGPSFGNRTGTVPFLGMGHGPSPVPGGTNGAWFMSDGTTVDCVITRTAAKVWGLNSDNTLRTGRAATASKPSASTVGDGSYFYDQTFKRPAFSDGTNWGLGLTATTPLTKTTNYSISTGDSIVLSNGTTLTMTLPAATSANIAGIVYTVKNINASAATVASAGGTIDGASTATLARWAVGRYVSDGTNWFAV